MVEGGSSQLKSAGEIFPKPFSPEALIRCIAEVLGGFTPRLMAHFDLTSARGAQWAGESVGKSGSAPSQFGPRP